LKSEFMLKNDDMKHCHNIHNCEHIIPIKTDNIVKFLKNTNEQEITHLVIDDREQRRALFVKDIFQNEDKFPYLTKIYDSNDDGFDYHVKIFKINFEKFSELYS